MEENINKINIIYKEENKYIKIPKNFNELKENFQKAFDIEINKEYKYLYKTKKNNNEDIEINNDNIFKEF